MLLQTHIKPGRSVPAGGLADPPSQEPSLWPRCVQGKHSTRRSPKRKLHF